MSKLNIILTCTHCEKRVMLGPAWTSFDSLERVLVECCLCKKVTHIDKLLRIQKHEPTENNYPSLKAYTTTMEIK